MALKLSFHARLAALLCSLIFGVLITVAPDILYAEDTDGDGKADKVEWVYRGFREGNQQHRVYGLTWGLDNWVYCANGDSGGRVTSPGLYLNSYSFHSLPSALPSITISGRVFVMFANNPYGLEM